MKKMIIICSVMATFAIAACGGKHADQENADSMFRYTDTNKVIDSTRADTTSDSTTNAPADVNN